MEQQPSKKRRGRPLKEPEEDRSAVSQRRARVRQAQRDFRRRKEETVTELRARIRMLEDTVEEMSTTVVGLSDSVLGSEHIRSHPQLITSIGNSVKRALTLAENATHDLDAASESVDDDEENPPDQSDPSEQPESARNVPIISSEGEPATAARFLTMNEMGMQDFYMDPPFEAVPSTQAAIPQRDPVPQNVRGMPTQNTFFTKEFWGGDYTTTNTTTTTNMHMVERPGRPLPFWERLLRLNLTSVIHRLTNDGTRGDADFCSRWEARGFKYSLRHKSKASLLAKTRWVIDTIAVNDAQVDSTERNVVGPSRKQGDWRPLVEAYFDNDDLRAFGAATMHSMVLAQYPVENLVNAEEVESYLKEKGMVEVGENEMQLELTIPTPPAQAADVGANDDINEVSQAPARALTLSRTSRPSSTSSGHVNRQGRPPKRVVTLSVETLIWKFIDLSICTGNGIGYPKESIDSAIVASVTRIGD